MSHGPSHLCLAWWGEAAGVEGTSIPLLVKSVSSALPGAGEQVLHSDCTLTLNYIFPGHLSAKLGKSCSLRGRAYLPVGYTSYLTFRDVLGLARV